MDGEVTLVVDVVVGADTVVEEATSLPIARSVNMVEYVGVDMLSRNCG